MDYDLTDIPAAYDRGRDHGPEVLNLWMSIIESHVDGESINTILDLGCGTGRFSERYLARLRGPTHIGYWIRTSNNELAGVINVSEIVRGAFQSAYLGYYAFVPHGGCGHMSRGLRAVLGEVFRVHRLHRVEANIQPGNVASRELVRGLGCRQEGFSPRYLKVGGRWRDHERWALTVEDWRKYSKVGYNRLEPARPRPCAIMSLRRAVQAAR